MTDRSITVLIVDDEPLARRLLRSMLTRFPQTQVIAEAGRADQALELIATLKPDLVFLDIQMPGQSGIEAVAQLPAPQRPHIVYVTAHEAYALRAFEVNAIDYLLKPVTFRRFSNCVTRAMDLILTQRAAAFGSRVRAAIEDDGESPGKVPILKFRSGKEYRSLSAGRIWYFEGANQYVEVVAESGRHLLSATLGSLQSRFGPAGFLRIHRSFLVNPAHIVRVLSDGNGARHVEMPDGHKLNLSRSNSHLLERIIGGT